LIPRFSIYYTNGEVVHGGGEDDEEITLTFSRKWLEAPSDGIATVIIEDKVIGRQQLQQYEYYYHFPVDSHGKGCVGASHKVGMYLRQMTDIGGLVKFGGWTETQHYYDINAAAYNSKHVPPRTNKLPEHEEDAAE
jgi:hypothetical protein